MQLIANDQVKLAPRKEADVALYAEEVAGIIIKTFNIMEPENKLRIIDDISTVNTSLSPSSSSLSSPINTRVLSPISPRSPFLEDLQKKHDAELIMLKAKIAGLETRNIGHDEKFRAFEADRSKIHMFEKEAEKIRRLEQELKKKAEKDHKIGAGGMSQL